MVEEIGQPTQETTVPEYNLLEKNLGQIFYRISAVTRPSVSRKSGNEIERSLLTRANRADLLKKFKSIPKEDKEKRSEILKEAHERDEIGRQFLNQGEFKIELPKLGEQMSKYVVLEPPESRKSAEDIAKPTIFLIVGTASDIDSAGGLAQEIAYLGRKVILVAYPSATLGEITPQFAQETVDPKTKDPHVSFFKEAISKFREKEGDLELWGFSGGGAIVSEILTDPKFQNTTPNAVLLSPASTNTQTRPQFAAGIAHELTYVVTKKLKVAAKSSMVFSRKEDDKPGQAELKDKAWKSMIKKAHTKVPVWKNARVKHGGKIIVFSGQKDRITKSYLAEEELSENTQMEIISDPEASHATALIESSKVLSKVFEAQNS